MDSRPWRGHQQVPPRAGVVSTTGKVGLDMTPPQSSGAGSPGNRGRDDANIAWAIMGSLLSGIVVWGGVGYLLDRALGTSFIVLIGVLVGIFAAFYLIFVKYLK
jgi:F0F1-type ATP synthase assembly protein I